MCFASYRSAVEEEVAVRVERREMFTAYNITLAVRAHGFAEYHSVLREVVHCLYRYGQMPETYRRTFAPVATGKEAFVYHHTDDNPFAYAKLRRRQRDWVRVGEMFIQIGRSVRSRANRFATVRNPVVRPAGME